jgi:hypothetical protein
MADCIQPGIVSAPLLAHELEELIGQRLVGVRSDHERQRLALAHPQDKPARRLEGGEVQFRVVFKLAPLRPDHRLGGSLENCGPGVRRYHCERSWQSRFPKSEADFDILRSITDLADADVDFLRVKDSGAR